MPKPKTPRPTSRDEDEAQSKRFLDLATELETAGDLNPTGADEIVDLILKRVAPERRRLKQRDAV